MNTGPLAFADVSFSEWCERVARILDRQGLTLAELPELPLADGFASGDTPAELIARCADAIDALGDTGARGSAFAGNQPCWPPPG